MTLAQMIVPRQYEMHETHGKIPGRNWVRVTGRGPTVYSRNNCAIQNWVVTQFQRSSNVRTGFGTAGVSQAVLAVV